MVKVNLGSEWAKVSRRYRNVQVVNIIDRGIALWGADLMVKEAKKEIDTLVYDREPPPGSVRTRRTRDAIKRERMRGANPMWRAFTAYVDKTVYPEYYYASILNYGGKPGGRMANYKARPFWTNAAKIVQALFKRKGVAVMVEIKNELLRA